MRTVGMDDRLAQHDPVVAVFRLDPDAVGESREHPAQPDAVVLPFQLGQELTIDRATVCLERLGCRPKDDSNGLAVVLPTEELAERQLPVLQSFDRQIEARGESGQNQMSDSVPLGFTRKSEHDLIQFLSLALVLPFIALGLELLAEAVLALAGRKPRRRHRGREISLDPERRQPVQ
jgi:hypothetical protein